MKAAFGTVGVPLQAYEIMAAIPATHPIGIHASATSDRRQLPALRAEGPDWSSCQVVFAVRAGPLRHVPSRGEDLLGGQDRYPEPEHHEHDLDGIHGWRISCPDVRSSDAAVNLTQG